MSDCAISCGKRKLESPSPVRFVHNGGFSVSAAIASEDFEALLARRPDILKSFAENDDLCWTVQAWCRLRDVVVREIEIAAEPAEGRINVSKSTALSRRGPDPKLFQVSLQADCPRVLWAQFHIQQNTDLLCEDGAPQCPWPQAAIVPRDKKRKGVKRIGFFGKLDGNLAGAAKQWGVGRFARMARTPEAAQPDGDSSRRICHTRNAASCYSERRKDCWTPANH